MARMCILISRCPSSTSSYRLACFVHMWLCHWRSFVCTRKGSSFQRQCERNKLWLLKVQRFIATQHSIDVLLNVRHVVVNGLIKFVPLLPIIEMLLYLPEQILVRPFGMRYGFL